MQDNRESKEEMVERLTRQFRELLEKKLNLGNSAGFTFRATRLGVLLNRWADGSGTNATSESVWFCSGMR